MLDFRQSLINSTLRKTPKRLHYKLEVLLTWVRLYVTYSLSLRHIKEMMQERDVLVDHVTLHKGTTKMERQHKFSKHLAFGAGEHLRSNNPADQEKAIVYNELVTNAVTLQNAVDQTQTIYTLKAKSVSSRPADLAFLSPYATNKLKRFGEYPTDLKPEAVPTQKTLKMEDLGDAATFRTNLTDGPKCVHSDAGMTLTASRERPLKRRNPMCSDKPSLWVAP